MTTRHDQVTVTTLPVCDLCASPAYADAKLPLYGSWGNVCKICFAANGCQLGLGKGQKLVLAKATS